MTDDISSKEKDSSGGLNKVSATGLVFIYISALLFGCVAFLFFQQEISGHLSHELSVYIPEFTLSAIAIFTAFLGVGLVRAAGLSTSVPTVVINPIEWDILKKQVEDGNEDSITQYIRLRSLTGFTGTFAKLGLQGLPLATIGLTILFSLLFLINKEYLELAKLTLGAFIGSFVQKQVGASQGGGTLKLPSGETVKVSPPTPSVA